MMALFTPRNSEVSGATPIGRDAGSSSQLLHGSGRCSASPEGRASRHLPQHPLLVTFGSVLAPDGGLQVRARILAESLAELGIPAVIVSTREPTCAQSCLPEWCAELHVPSRKPTLGFSVEFAGLIRHASASADLIIVSNAMFMPSVALAGVRLPLVWDTNECKTLHYRRLQSSPSNLAKHLVWYLLEEWAGHRCQRAVSIGDTEAVAWRSIHPSLGGKVVTVDHSAFANVRLAEGARRTLSRSLGLMPEGPLLVFVGTMMATHNLVAARWIVDVLAPSLPPAATVVICGMGSDRLVTGDRGARVLCLGTVTDVDAVIAAADLCLAPLASGAGIKTKVLHYLAHGRRIAGTPIAFEGLEGAPGLIGANLAELPGVVAKLIAAPEPAAEGCARAHAQRAWLEEKHGRDRVVEQWRETLLCLPPR